MKPITREERAALKLVVGIFNKCGRGLPVNPKEFLARCSTTISVQRLRSLIINQPEVVAEICGVKKVEWSCGEIFKTGNGAFGRLGRSNFRSGWQNPQIWWTF